LNIISWIERVPSQSNPADVLSRELVLHHLGLSRAEVDLETMWQQCTDATLLQGRPRWHPADDCETLLPNASSFSARMLTCHSHVLLFEASRPQNK
jgi:hypothetical protein